MASAKKEAQSRLGREDDYINLKGLNQERNIANQTYNTNTTSFQNAYNDLLNDISSRRNSARIDFSKGRAAVGENAYLQNRRDTTDLASRGLNGGLAQLNKLGNRMETGRQYSDLANTFYNSMSDIDATERTGTNEYNTQMEMAKNDLDARLADINARERAGRNAYRAAVAQLAEQIQARRDAAAAAARQYALQVQNAKKAQQNEFDARLFDLWSNGENEQSYKDAINWYKKVKGGTDADATKYFNKIGLGYGVGQPGVVGPTQPWVAPKANVSTTNSSGNWLSNLWDNYVKMQPYNRK